MNEIIHYFVQWRTMKYIHNQWENLLCQRGFNFVVYYQDDIEIHFSLSLSLSISLNFSLFLSLEFPHTTCQSISYNNHNESFVSSISCLPFFPYYCNFTTHLKFISCPVEHTNIYIHQSNHRFCFIVCGSLLIVE